MLCWCGISDRPCGVVVVPAGEISDSNAVGIAQLAHAAGESVLCRAGWRRGSSEMTSENNCKELVLRSTGDQLHGSNIIILATSPELELSSLTITETVNAAIIMKTTVIVLWMKNHLETCSTFLRIR